MKELRDTCTQHGALLIMDEVKTGFEWHPVGLAMYNIHADLTTYAKAIEMGIPSPVLVERRNHGCHWCRWRCGSRGHLHDLVALSAQCHRRHLANTDALATVDRVGAGRDVLGRASTNAGIEHRFAGPPSMFGIHFGDHVPSNYRDWKSTNSDFTPVFAWSVIEHGVMLELDSREPWFICEAHQDMDLGWLEDMATRSMKIAMDAS